MNKQSQWTANSIARAGVRVLGWVGVVLVALTLLAVVVIAFGPLPSRVLQGSPAAAGLAPVDRVKAEADVRTSLLQAVAGMLLVLGAATAWRQMLIARSQHRLSRRTAVTEAFTKAIEQLGDVDSTALRLGGIYSLDRVADDDKTEARRVAEILSAFVREQAKSESASRDVTAAVLILARREWPGRVDLAGAVLVGMDLGSASLPHARLVGVDLGGANLRDALLPGADLSDANLRGANLAGTDLREARLEGAKLSGATASPTTCWPAGFVPADHGVRTA